MDFRVVALCKLIFLTLWTTVCGPLSGFTMGLFFLVYQDGWRKGVLPPQPQGVLFNFDFAAMTSRFGGSSR